MKTYATYFQNDKEKPLVYGEINLINPKRKRLRTEEEKEGILAKTVIAGFCGTDHELMRMGSEGLLDSKFPEGEKRLINGHEGVVWVPSQNRFAIVLIRGGNAYDPTRYTEEESYFEYGCDQADVCFPIIIIIIRICCYPFRKALLRMVSWPFPLQKKWYFPILTAVWYFSWREWRIWEVPITSELRWQKINVGKRKQENWLRSIFLIVL